MSKFLTPLDVTLLNDSEHDGRGTWRVDSPLIYSSDVAMRSIRVPPGFVTDFASVPRIPVAFFLTADCAHEAAVVHDYLYTYGTLSRAMADSVLLEAMAVSGIPAWRRRLIYWGVRLGGASHFKGA